MGYRDRLKFNIPNLTYAEPSYGTPVGYNNQSPAQRLSKPLQNLLGVAGKVAQQDIAKTQQEEVQAFKLEGIELDKQAKLKQIKFDKEFKESQLKWKFEYDQDKISYEEMKEQQIREGGLLRRKYNKKSFAEAQRDGDIPPTGNPYLAWGWYEAEGQRAKLSFQNEVRAAFAQATLNPDKFFDPVEGLAAFEEMMALNRAKSYIQLPQNYVAQEEFLKGSESFYASMKAQYNNLFAEHSLGVRQSGFNSAGMAAAEEHFNDIDSIGESSPIDLWEMLDPKDPEDLKILESLKNATPDTEEKVLEKTRSFLINQAREDLIEDYQAIYDGIYLDGESLVGANPTDFFLTVLGNSNLSPLDQERVIQNIKAGTDKLSNTDKGKAFLNTIHEVSKVQATNEWYDNNRQAINNLYRGINQMPYAVTNETELDDLNKSLRKQLDDLVDRNLSPDIYYGFDRQLGAAHLAASRKIYPEPTTASIKAQREQNQVATVLSNVTAGNITGSVNKLVEIKTAGATSTSIIEIAQSELSKHRKRYNQEYKAAVDAGGDTPIPPVPEELGMMYETLEQFRSKTNGNWTLGNYSPQELPKLSKSESDFLLSEFNAGRLNLHMNENSGAYEIFNKSCTANRSGDPESLRNIVSANLAVWEKKKVSEEQYEFTGKVSILGDEKAINVDLATFAQKVIEDEDIAINEFVQHEMYQAYHSEYLKNKSGGENDLAAKEMAMQHVQKMYKAVTIKYDPWGTTKQKFYFVDNTEDIQSDSYDTVTTMGTSEGERGQILRNLMDEVKSMQPINYIEGAVALRESIVDEQREERLDGLWQDNAQAYYEGKVADADDENKSFSKFLDSKEWQEFLLKQTAHLQGAGGNPFGTQHIPLLLSQKSIREQIEKNGGLINGPNINILVNALANDLSPENPSQWKNKFKDKLAKRFIRFEVYTPKGQAKIVEGKKQELLDQYNADVNDPKSQESRDIYEGLKDVIKWNSVNDNFDTEGYITINDVWDNGTPYFTMTDENGEVLRYTNTLNGIVYFDRSTLKPILRNRK